MKKITATFAAVAMAITMGATTAQADNTSIASCKGQPFTNDYIITPYPTFAPLTAHDFNAAAGSTLVKDITNGNVITPFNPDADCKAFMKKIINTGLVQNIEPNYIMKTQTTYR